MHVPSKEIVRSCIWVLGVSILPLFLRYFDWILKLFRQYGIIDFCKTQIDVQSLNQCPISASQTSVPQIHVLFFKFSNLRPMTSNTLGQVFEAMIDKRQDQIPDEGFLITKKEKVSKGPNTETVCADIPYIAVKNIKVVYNKWK